ncbi:MAG TPA: SDR family oxidoreductase [Capsulimonadaceae bacterium]|jgi:3-oxoacyl-[acyl-carrier protein] reductase
MNTLTNKRALITGSSQGIGRSIALRMASEGATVIVNNKDDQTAAQRVVDEIVATGGSAVAICADIADEAQVAALFEEAGTVDILVNNARLDPYMRSSDDSDGAWFEKVIHVNLTGAYLCSMAFFEQAKLRGWGRIVNISSVRSFIPAEMNMIAYGVSKLGMHGLTRALAENGGQYGITANSIAPGMVATENIDRRLTPAMRAAETAKIPLGRAATCDEIVDAVMFVISNGYVTGETININGGMHYAP